MKIKRNCLKDNPEISHLPIPQSDHYLYKEIFSDYHNIDNINNKCNEK